MMLYMMLVVCFTMTSHGLLTSALETCSVTNRDCEVNENLIHAFPEIYSIQECRELCKNTSECEVISYHGQDSVPYKNFCMTYTQCSLLNDCEDCFTEAKPCFDVCDITNDGYFVHDTVDVITNVADEASCVTQCWMNPDCKFYTYYTASDQHYPRVCNLLSNIEGPIKPCLHCRTGFPDCKKITTDICHFSVGDKNEKNTSYKATDTSASINLTISAEALFSLCDLTIVAIGGGGSPGSGNYGNGGGSGYIETATISSLSDRPLLVNVGGGTEESRVDTAAGETIVRAHPGGYGSSYDRGDGYSGGGAGTSISGYHGGSGGSNGGDGNDSSYGNHGGKGSGLDISTIALEHFKLTPAAGGEGCDYFGGGGGGVLVDGQRPHNGGSYGAGGSPCNNADPAQGIVLIEIKKKQ